MFYLVTTLGSCFVNALSINGSVSWDLISAIAIAVPGEIKTVLNSQTISEKYFSFYCSYAGLDNAADARVPKILSLQGTYR